ncbi:MAG: FAD-dependent oxidoreductase [Myxococcota bacterium]
MTASTRPAELPVVVVGGGFAGVGAAWAAARAGRPVVVVHAGAGASALYSGIVDGSAPSAEALELALLLGLAMGSVPRAVATREGGVRLASGRDRALLDLDALAGRRIAVLDLGRDDWDAELLAKSFTESAWGKRTRTQFEAVRVNGLLDGAERRIAAHDLATRFDDSARVGALARQMRDASPDAAAWLTPPLLGVRSEAASQLAALLSRPVGETSSAPAGAAGARFELRRDELFDRLGVRNERARVENVAADESALRVELSQGESLRARAVVLALGGVAAGGIVLSSLMGQPLQFALSLSADAVLRCDGELLDAGSSLWGPSFVRNGLSLLERVGVHADVAGRVSSAQALFAAGDLVADRPRTVLEALAAGTRTGLAASQFVG